MSHTHVYKALPIDQNTPFLKSYYHIISYHIYHDLWATPAVVNHYYQFQQFLQLITFPSLWRGTYITHDCDVSHSLWELSYWLPSKHNSGSLIFLDSNCFFKQTRGIELCKVVKDLHTAERRNPEQSLSIQEWYFLPYFLTLFIFLLYYEGKIRDIMQLHYDLFNSVNKNNFL